MGGVAALARSRGTRRAPALVAGALALACASTPKGVVHEVRAGENVYRIARHYGVAMDDVIRANHIGDVTSIPVGARLVIPGATEARPAASLAVAAAAPPRPRGDRKALARREADLVFAWPLRGRISSGYGRRGRRRHDGIDIPARRGTAIVAAEAGRVIHSGGGLGDYGRVVIVKHAGNYSTVYAHNSRTLVRKGDFVEKGQPIGEVGSTGNASGPHLHFEIRRRRQAEDPLRYLP